MRWWAIAGAALLFNLASAACDDAVERDAPARYYVAPDAGGPDSVASRRDAQAPTLLDGSTDAPTDATAPAGFPSTLPLTGWWHASYGGSPWVGSASAGTSLGRDLTEPTTPPVVGTAIGGFTPAGFDGMNDKLGSALAVSTYVAVTAWEAHGLFSADSARAHIPNTAYSFPALLTDSVNGYFYVAFSSAGIMAGHYDGVSFKEVVAACPTGGLHAFQAWFDGTALNLVIDGGAPAAPVATAPPTFGLGLMKVGSSYNDAAPFDGRIVELMTASQVLSAPARAGVRAYFNARYGTTFP